MKIKQLIDETNTLKFQLWIGPNRLPIAKIIKCRIVYPTSQNSQHLIILTKPKFPFIQSICVLAGWEKFQTKLAKLILLNRDQTVRSTELDLPLKRLFMTKTHDTDSRLQIPSSFLNMALWCTLLNKWILMISTRSKINPAGRILQKDKPKAIQIIRYLQISNRHH
jgi:hypothetical protein